MLRNVHELDVDFVAGGKVVDIAVIRRRAPYDDIQGLVPVHAWQLLADRKQVDKLARLDEDREPRILGIVTRGRGADLRSKRTIELSVNIIGAFPCRIARF